MFVTINDWPALSNLLGQTNKGYHACTHCLDDTESKYLDKCRKIVYLGHRRFLPTNHQCRKKGKHFKGEADHRKKPSMRTGDHVLAMVNDLHVIFGKGPGGLAVLNDAEGRAPMTQLLSVALRGLLPENVRLAIVKLCAFLNAISQKVINPEDLPRL